MCTSDFLDEMAARIESLGFEAGVALDCAVGIGDTPIYVDGNLEAGDAEGRRVVLPGWVRDAEESRWLSPLPEEVRWHRLAEWWEGMAVESAEGKCYTVFWEQKPGLVRIGILALLPHNFDDNAALKVPLDAGELADLDADSSVSGCIRDAELLAIWKQRRQAWEDEGGTTMNETPPLPETEEPYRGRPVPVVTLRPGTVDCAQPHVELWAEKGNQLVVRVAPADLAEPEAGAFVIQWEEEEAAQRWRKEAEEALDFYLVSKEEMWPWGYLCYHCGTGADWYAHEGGGVFFVQRDPAEEARRAGVAAAQR